MGDLLPGSILYTVLLYSVSEPGVWRADDIVDDLADVDPGDVDGAVSQLIERGFIHINSTDQRLWPLRAGRAALQPRAEAAK